VEPLLPDTRQARRLVVTLAIFWGGWGLSLIGFWLAPVAGVMLFAITFAAGLLFYLTLYGIWERESGISAWRMMFVPGFSRNRRRAALHLADLFRPSWIKHTLRETGWPPRFVGTALLATLAVDLLIFATVAPRIPTS
jgi:hypothetical protein